MEKKTIGLWKVWKTSDQGFTSQIRAATKINDNLYSFHNGSILWFVADEDVYGLDVSYNSLK